MLAQLSENDELVLGPWGGLGVGVLVGGTLPIVSPHLGLELAWSVPWLPWLLGAIFGSLYGACQLRVPIRGLVAVGIFYGVFLWVLTNLIGWLAFPVTASQIRSWPGFGTFVFFTFCLGLCSVIVTLFRGDDKSHVAQH